MNARDVIAGVTHSFAAAAADDDVLGNPWPEDFDLADAALVALAADGWRVVRVRRCECEDVYCTAHGEAVHIIKEGAVRPAAQVAKDMPETPEDKMHRKAVHAYLSPEAHAAWQEEATENGVSVSGLLEAIGQALATGGDPYSESSVPGLLEAIGQALAWRTSPTLSAPPALNAPPSSGPQTQGQ